MKQPWNGLITIGLVVVISFGLISRVLALSGDLDPAFGTAGVVITDLNTNFDQANAVAIQADGSVVAAGFTTAGGGSANFLVAQYTSGGNPDIAFGTGGQATSVIGSAGSNSMLRP